MKTRVRYRKLSRVLQNKIRTQSNPLSINILFMAAQYTRRQQPFFLQVSRADFNIMAGPL